MIVYHGSDRKLSRISAGSWVTDDLETAHAFASQKASSTGGAPTVHSLEIIEEHVEWDIVSNAAGIDDARGTLLRDHPVSEIVWALAPTLP